MFPPTPKLLIFRPQRPQFFSLIPFINLKNAFFVFNCINDGCDFTSEHPSSNHQPEESIQPQSFESLLTIQSISCFIQNAQRSSYKPQRKKNPFSHMESVNPADNTESSAHQRLILLVLLMYTRCKQCLLFISCIFLFHCLCTKRSLEIFFKQNTRLDQCLRQNVVTLSSQLVNDKWHKRCTSDTASLCCTYCTLDVILYKPMGGFLLNPHILFLIHFFFYLFCIYSSLRNKNKQQTN